jgi:hypothetical protein
LFQPGQNHRFDNAVDVLLGELGKDSGGGSALPDQTFEIGNAIVAEA